MKRAFSFGTRIRRRRPTAPIRRSSWSTRSTAAAPCRTARLSFIIITKCRTTPPTHRSTHTWRFGARLRAVSIVDTSEQNFNGTYIFGGAYAPVLDANNQPVVPGVICNPAVQTRGMHHDQFDRTVSPHAAVRANGNAPADDSSAGRRSDSIFDQHRRSRGVRRRRGYRRVRRRRLESEAESDAEPRRALRNAGKYSRPFRFRAAPGVRVGARRHRRRTRPRGP